MQPSNTYYLRIDASASPGEYNFTQTFYPLANNDDFANATPLQPTEIIYDNGIRYEYSQTGGIMGPPRSRESLSWTATAFGTP